MTNISEVRYITIDPDYEGQRIDNFLLNMFKGVPKSRIYKAMRKGEVRVNKKRIKAPYRLQADDVVRIPPLTQTERTKPTPSVDICQLLEESILYEDAGLIIINKPSGVAVHGGSGVSVGVIEAMRESRPKIKRLELVHRLDKDTSGCLMIAKKHSVLRELHHQLREKQIQKIYWALVQGRWPQQLKHVKLPLEKNVLRSGERMVRVSERGKPAHTQFTVVTNYKKSTLVAAEPITGRTHQIRVHCMAEGHPIAGDQKYMDEAFNKTIKRMGCARLCLHAKTLSFTLNEEDIVVTAPLDKSFATLLEKLK